MCSVRSRKAYNQRNVTDYSNPLRGIVPKAVRKDDADDAALVELIERLPGEVSFDAYVKALLSTPEVAARITELENSLQRLANAVWASGMIDKGPGLREAAEEAKLVLKNRLEVNEVASQITKRVSARVNAREEPFQDDLRLINPLGSKASDDQNIANSAMDDVKLVVVKSYGSRPEADIAKAALEAAGIPAMTRADTVGGMREHIAWSASGFQVLVREQDAALARDVLTPTAEDNP